MISSRFPPTLIPSMPLSQPSMTSPAPSLNEKGVPLSRELSNFFAALSVLIEPARIVHFERSSLDRLLARACYQIDLLQAVGLVSSKKQDKQKHQCQRRRTENRWFHEAIPPLEFGIQNMDRP